jgi:hypothetical protein
VPAVEGLVQLICRRKRSEEEAAVPELEADMARFNVYGWGVKSLVLLMISVLAFSIRQGGAEKRRVARTGDGALRQPQPA